MPDTHLAFFDGVMTDEKQESATVLKILSINLKSLQNHGSSNQYADMLNSKA
ncbi:MAG: hypothetical protein MUF49_25485 [Oculatellaceae cyanobacterium Prado106]|jgi:hypothetical protein|nr:hypothetical protein [Oculatellaceae cyanobacterium Prado106]